MAAEAQKSRRFLKIPLVTVILLVAIAGAVVAMIIGLSNTIKSTVYSERKASLSRLMENKAQVINEIIDFNRSMTDMVAGNAIHDLPGDSSVREYLESLGVRQGYDGILTFMVDSNGKYISSDGGSGKIVDTTYYTGQAEDELFYLSSLPHLGPEKTFLIFRNRLPKPVTGSGAGENAEYLFCGILFDLDELAEALINEFGGEANAFIYDAGGTMFYRHLGLGLVMDGFNIYTKFSRSVLPFGESPEDVISACRNGETVAVELKIKGKDYYFASTKLNANGWSLALITKSEGLNNLSGSSETDTVVYFALIFALLCAAVAIAFAAVYQVTASQKSIREITRLNTELENATRAKSDFLSNMSHDIRTPINGIMGMTTLALNEEDTPEKTREYLMKIEGASNHLLSLINDVLDMTRIESGKVEITNAPIDIRRVADNCLSIIRGQIGKRDIHLVSEVKCEHPFVLGDDLHLRQIFLNILGNAVKFTGDGGTIRFGITETEATDTSVVLRFEAEDNGIGMSSDFLPKIFDAFTQSSDAARTNYKGTGLGMSITKQLTELMGGTITVESELGKGSLFTVTIPFAPSPETPLEVAEKALDGENSKIAGVKVLLVEDNELNMEIAASLLEKSGAVISRAENGREAVDAFAASDPGTYDVILMDLMMPVMNGIEATRTIRTLPRADAATVPILAMTANAFEADVRQTREAGMNAHLAKPIVIDEVVATIAKFAGKQ